MEMKNTGVQFEDELYILKSTSEIGNKGLLRPKMGRTTREKTSPAEESMPKGTEFCGRCLFGEMRLKNVITRQPPLRLAWLPGILCYMSLLFIQYLVTGGLSCPGRK